MAGDEYPEPRYASWGQRAGALLLDGLVIVAPFFLLAFVLLLVIGPDDNSATDDSAGYGALVGIVAMIVAPFYFTLMHGRPSGQTLGKRALKIAVRREGSLASIGYGRAFGRAVIFSLFLATSTLLIDILWPLWDRRKQALHDKVVSSVVVRTDG